ncbi:cupin domain-containing protein [Flavisolibacter tropicus]|uniref:Cupin n=1 Tax=Flavisolibacter tropicus TaxID=1492898 RepID=A0A172TT89_9BACT|nr:cupin domain-containing protein [Flavisolibacter tropicus]ANE50094.1 cupin [Flavisolibacter tropicus]
MKRFMITSLAFATLLSLGCNKQAGKNASNNESESIFPKGDAGPDENFTGKAWNYGLVTNDSLYNTVVGNVYFEPGARSNWHTHPAGQILIITDGVGYHQIKGQPRQTIRKGAVVKCPPNVEHWHGASPDTGLQQLYIVPNTEKGIVQWLQPVTDQEYNNQ